jgi:NAD(P)-dependent dehydrogenase (short-subunit alcohol dehydrogenase family)
VTAAAEVTDLRGRVAVVTGASRGLGADIAAELAARGMKVVLTGRTESDLETTASQIREQGGEAVAIRADVSVPDQVAALRTATERELGPVGVLVNSAGIFGPVARIVDSDVGEWIATQQVNLIGPYLTCREFVRGMIDAGWGRIVNVSSSASLGPPEPFGSAYATSKAALNRLTRQLAVELEGSGVSVNAIHPGSLKTDMWNDIRQKVAVHGDQAAGFTEWLRLMEETGGDSPAQAVALTVRVIGEPASVNGLFHWPDEGLEKPMPSW